MPKFFVRRGLGGFEYPATPGPWHVNSGCIVDSRGNIIATRHSRRHLDHKGDYHGEDNIEPVEADSNCHLLAAAPALRDALAALLAYVNEHSDAILDATNVHIDQHNALLDAAQTALQSVSGGTRP